MRYEALFTILKNAMRTVFEGYLYLAMVWQEVGANKC